jgi:protein phosphatase
MDQIAIISDIHGNMPALEATLADIRARGINRIFCLGDLVGKGPHSELAVDRCRDACELIVRGNWDEFIGAATDSATLQWHQRRLGPERLGYLAALPPTIEFLLSGRQVRLFHASQQGIHHRVHMRAADDAHEAMFSNTDFTGYAVTPDVVGYGDIHVAYLKSFRQRMLFNAGSVGNPLDGTLASYAILEGVYGSADPAPLALQIVRLPYDVELAIAQAEELDMPDLAAYRDELRTGRYRGLPKASA